MKTLFVLAVLAFVSCKEKTVHPTKGEIVEAVYGLGTVESEEIYQAKFGIPIAVKEFFVSEGEDVKKGQKLFQIDQGILFQSPISGRVTDIPANVKENVSAQALVLTVTNLEKLYLSVALEQQAAMKLKKGLKTEISFEFFRNKKLGGVIDSYYPKNNEFIAKVKFTEHPEGVLPGMTADVAFEIARKPDAILVPSKAVSNGHISILKNGKKEHVQVKIGLADLEQIEILEPQLSVEDEIVVP